MRFFRLIGHFDLSQESIKVALTVALLGMSMAGSVATKAQADEIYTFVVKKQEEKAKTRWSLSDWLEQRDKMRLMDLWLALHSPSPYEFFIGGDFRGAKSSGFGAHAGAYASIFGLETSYEKVDIPRWLALFGVRIFGFQHQGTHILIQGGVRQTNAALVYRQAVAGLHLSICLSRFFGLDGTYRHHFSSIPASAAAGASGNRYEAGAFMDFKFLRIYGDYYVEAERPSANPERSGFLLGSRVYF